MLTLLEHIDRLLEWCDCSEKPPHEDIRVLNTRDVRVHYIGGSPNHNGWTCPPAALQKPEHFAHEFNELQRSGYSWINLSVYGVLDLILIVGVELPGGGEVGVPIGKTSINYSGPRIDPSTGCSDWLAHVNVS